MTSERNEPPSDSGEHEPLTLDNTSRLLVNTLRFLIDEYGLAGVRSTLDMIEAAEAERWCERHA